MPYETKALDDAFAWAVCEPGDGIRGETGLTKREFFAALAMTGMFAHWDMPTADICESAVKAADHLINALNQQPNPSAPEPFPGDLLPDAE